MQPMKILCPSKKLLERGKKLWVKKLQAKKLQVKKLQAKKFEAKKLNVNFFRLNGIKSVQTTIDFTTWPQYNGYKENFLAKPQNL